MVQHAQLLHSNWPEYASIIFLLPHGWMPQGQPYVLMTRRATRSASVGERATRRLADAEDQMMWFTEVKTPTMTALPPPRRRLCDRPENRATTNAHSRRTHQNSARATNPNQESPQTNPLAVQRTGPPRDSHFTTVTALTWKSRRLTTFVSSSRLSRCISHWHVCTPLSRTATLSAS